jgi:hypothetical protein
VPFRLDAQRDAIVEGDWIPVNADILENGQHIHHREKEYTVPACLRFSSPPKGTASYCVAVVKLVEEFINMLLEIRHDIFNPQNRSWDVEALLRTLRRGDEGTLEDFEAGSLTRSRSLMKRCRGSMRRLRRSRRQEKLR